ncbi:Iron/manganese superoxide dismutase, alpha-hairpin domain family protein [Leishmania donovani]|uniref:Iron/manganese superoxide dismutase, alpha-hairpin domain family protein n=1 Tax=Leishmania donovani TaxID=5661 RepID=A0A504X2I1_LEIDO|nr:Iron/manganese superoxide dismutase, alpha-hairpin domain family protein [Leishmania donovani]
MNGQTAMDELPSTARLSSDLCATFSEYLESAYPHSGPLSWNEAAQLLSAFTGVSVHHIAAALGWAAACEKAAVSKDDLHSSLEQLMRTNGSSDAWWDSPGVTMPELTGAADQESSEGAGSTKHCGWESLASVRARSHRPLPPGSTSTEGPHDSKMGAWSGQPSLHPTLNSWGRRDSKLSGTCSVPRVLPDRPQSTAASMECVVATALGELDLYVEDEHEVTNETERFGMAAAQHRRVGNRSHSPSPVPLADKQAACHPRSPVAPTTTLAELDRFVHRGKTAKVCKQFSPQHRMRRMSSRNGCPEDAPKPVGSCATAAEHFSSLRRSLIAPLPGSLMEGAPSQSAWAYMLSMQPISPTCLSARQAEAAAMTEREEEGRSRSVSLPRVPGITPAAPLHSTAHPSAAPAPRGQYSPPRKVTSAHEMPRSNPQQLQIGFMRVSLLRRFCEYVPKGAPTQVSLAVETPYSVTRAFRMTEMAAAAADAERDAKGFFYLPRVDYDVGQGVAPLMSRKQFDVQYHVFHKAAVDRLNAHTLGSELEGHNLNVVIRNSSFDASRAVIHAAASEHFNYCFWYRSLRPWGTAVPARLKEELQLQYSQNGTLDAVEEVQRLFTVAALSQQSAGGWVYLVWTGKAFDVIPFTTGAALSAAT